MIAALATPRIMDSFGRAKAQAAQVQMSNIKAAVQIYYLDTGSYPSQSDGLSALLQAPTGASSWRGPYLDVASTKDPWGRDWIYQQPGTSQPFDIETLGADGQPGGTNEDADIKL
ncbi:UNVERIFIED_CONTAM: hypothetical protein GTU68_060808 [Idotea baltica]|nr:hypothetical protein [Idotea baltica]